MFNFIRALIKTLAGSITVIIAFSAALGTTIGVTEGKPIVTPKHNYCYDNDRLLLGGYNFDLRYADDEHVTQVKDAGIDFLISGVNSTMLELCDQKGVGIIAKNFPSGMLPSFYATIGQNSPWETVTRAQLAPYDHDCVWGYDLIDEPNAKYFDDIGRIVSHFNSEIPDKNCYVNLFPMYANNEQLGNDPAVPTWKKLLFPLSDFSSEQVDQYKRHISDYINKIPTDYICLDLYPLTQRVSADGTVAKTTNDTWLRNMDIIAEACRKTNKDFWIITQSSGNSADGKGTMRWCDDEEDIRWQMYTSLSFGAKAVIHACYSGGWWDRDSHAIAADGSRTDTYYAIKTVNNEVKPFAEIYGNYVYTGTFLHNKLLAAGIANGGYLMPLDKGVSKPEIASVSPLLVGCFAAENGIGSAYAVTNMKEIEKGGTADALISVKGASSVTVWQKGEKTVYEGSSAKLTLEAGEGVFITVA